MTRQADNELILNQLSRMGETMLDGILDGILGRIHKDVEEAECPKCFGHGEYIEGRSDSDWGEVVKCNCRRGKA